MDTLGTMKHATDTEEANMRIGHIDHDHEAFLVDDGTTHDVRGEVTPMKTFPNTYDEAAAMLGKRSSRKIGNNTYLELDHDGSIGVRLHSTRVVVWYPDGTARLYTGGWNT